MLTRPLSIFVGSVCHFRAGRDADSFEHFRRKPPWQCTLQKKSMDIYSEADNHDRSAQRLVIITGDNNIHTNKMSALGVELALSCRFASLGTTLWRRQRRSYLLDC